jgi:oligoribonuclease (3'-5' exoribonuclease)
VRAMPAVIWIDDQIVGYGIENETLTQITAITADSSLIHENGVVSLSYGENKEGRIRLSQKLQLNREGENQ